METTTCSRYDKGYRQVHFNLKQTRERTKLTQIFISVTVSGQRLRVYSKLRVEPEYWNRHGNRCQVGMLVSKRVQNRVRDINSKLDYIESQIEYTDHVCAEKGVYLTKENIRKVIEQSTDRYNRQNRHEDAITIMKQIAAGYQNALNKRGRIGQANTGRTYLMAISRLEKFVVSTNRKDLKFCDIDRRFITDFTNYLTKCTFKCGADAKHYTAITIASTMGAIRNIMRRAYDMELSDNPCQNLFDTCTAGESSDKIYLNERELARLARVNIPDNSEMEIRDMFVIAAYTGLRISDINCLNRATLTPGQITLVQTKTNELVHIPILKEVANLIGKYRCSQFPKIDKGKANRCIKELAKRAGINDTIIVWETRGGVRQFRSVPKYTQISFHTARRSCITNLFKRGYSANYIMSLSGHKSIASFQRYIKSSAEEMSQAFIRELRRRKDVASITRENGL